jgi:hypothetical protein
LAVVKVALLALWTVILRNPWAAASIFSGYLWGIALGMPGDTLARPTYRHMREVMPEEAWTLLFFVVAILQTWRMFERTTPRTIVPEFFLKWVAALLWTFVGLACLTSQWPIAAAMSDTLVVALFSWIDLAQLRCCTYCPAQTATCKQDGCKYDR